jgi:hypothetical protein
MPIHLTKSEFKRFREQLYNQFEHYSDSSIPFICPVIPARTKIERHIAEALLEDEIVGNDI